MKRIELKIRNERFFLRGALDLFLVSSSKRTEWKQGADVTTVAVGSMITCKEGKWR